MLPTLLSSGLLDVLSVVGRLSSNGPKGGIQHKNIFLVLSVLQFCLKRVAKPGNNTDY